VFIYGSKGDWIWDRGDHLWETFEGDHLWDTFEGDHLWDTFFCVWLSDQALFFCIYALGDVFLESYGLDMYFLSRCSTVLR
jgi:hypothetical protein